MPFSSFIPPLEPLLGLADAAPQKQLSIGRPILLPATFGKPSYREHDFADAGADDTVDLHAKAHVEEWL